MLVKATLIISFFETFINSPGARRRECTDRLASTADITTSASVEQTSQLVSSLPMHNCWDAGGTFSTQTDQSIKALIARSSEEWRKKKWLTFHLLRLGTVCVHPDQLYRTLVLFLGQPLGDCWEIGQSPYVPFWTLWCHPQQNCNWKLIFLLSNVHVYMYKHIVRFFSKRKVLKHTCTYNKLYLPSVKHAHSSLHVYKHKQ